ncbi:fungal-specific transcription factor domain-containing protein [Phaeosphaeria sp. MPI-PUGE-AT-0046c]|nr:fungal-specific transcription factor domain-containing protein [Phaeosphaeria sp. MPI-PUGE-AT-0046c]
MAETVILSSPSVALNVSESLPKIPTPVTKNTRSAQPAPKNAPKASETAGVTKRKQSKSRNGCITCKGKRLKCDETKPTCKQCARRSVACGGYKKDFKWRPFEEPNVPGKHSSLTSSDSDLQGTASAPASNYTAAGFHDVHYGLPGSAQNIFYHPHPTQYPPPQSVPLQTPFIQQHPQQAYQPIDNPYAVPLLSPFLVPPQPISPVDSFAPGSLAGSHSTFSSGSIKTRKSKVTAASSVSSGQSPRLVDLLQPGTDLSVPPEEYNSFISQHGAFYQPTGLTPPAEGADDGIEEIPRNNNTDPETWVMRLPSPTSSSSSSSSPDSPNLPMLVQPQFSLASPEHLTRRYNRDTCGVLSVKDGPTENPWRTLVWPLARDCPALYHAIASMTSFHQSKEVPSMRIQGIDHMRSAVHALAEGLQNMRFDAAISTTLVLAFSESWDQHISTGINHIKGAKILINQALVQHRQVPKQGEEWNRLKFLCNTWIYMDVIARLTSADDDENNDVDFVHESIYASGEVDTKLDPLMGCAHTLFPIIGRVANLVRRVRRTESNGPSIISHAIHLKTQLEGWTPPSFIEDPEDETTSPRDSIKTAIAYQYATLLYLHQAVPEIPSEPSSVLANRVLRELATVEPRSRSVIVHIYPLMAAGCEVMEQEDRDWVKKRWGEMASRMKLGILEKTLDVTREVWNRRDEYAADRKMLEEMPVDSFIPNAPVKRDFDTFFDDFQAEGDFCWLDAAGPKRRVIDPTSSYTVPVPSHVAPVPARQSQVSNGNTEFLEHVFTVKGRLHWLGVMKDWNWEGMCPLLFPIQI